MLVSLADELVFNLTLPAKVQAYMSCAKPILGMLNGEGQEIIQKAECGWCVGADDVERISETILNICKLRKEDLIDIGQKGYNYYLSHFQKDICIDIIDNALKQYTNSK